MVRFSTSDGVNLKSVAKAFGVLVMTGAIVILVGCEAKGPEPEVRPIQNSEYDSMLVILFDTSGSFALDLRQKAFPFCEKAIDNFYRDRLGEGNDIVIIAQLSGGVTQSLIWQGSPRDFRNHFTSSRDFHDWIMKKSDPYGSRVYGGVNDSLKYLMSLGGVRNRKCHTALLMCSDFDDNDRNGDAEKARFAKLLSEYGKTKCCVGCYWVSLNRYEELKTMLDQSGIKDVAIHSSIDHGVKLPKWSD